MIVETELSPCTLVSTSTQLAVAYDLSAIFVTARVDDTAVRDVHPGQPLDITVETAPLACTRVIPVKPPPSGRRT
jgi:multidrug resistance efflux pump